MVNTSIKTTKSQEIFAAAQNLMPGGVSSPVRAFKSVGGQPIVFDHVNGAYIWDVDGNKYIDYVGTWGPAICGHAHPEVISALHTAIQSLGEVMVVAPASGQSAESHGITFHTPLMTRNRSLLNGANGTAVVGTPADCVKLGLRALWKEKYGANSQPDVVVSGMNFGANVGINVIYSGTIAAAVEAAFLGVPAIAVSLHIGDRSKTNLPRAAAIAR